MDHCKTTVDTNLLATLLGMPAQLFVNVIQPVTSKQCI